MQRLVISFFALSLMVACGDDDQPAVGGGTGGTGGTAGSAGTGGPGGSGGGSNGMAEACNGQDDDQDGFVDEGLSSRPCSSACGTGNEVCNQGAWGGCDAPAVIDEFCDGADNDCDGNTDEGLTRACSTDCGTGDETCSAGEWVGCNAPAGDVESCDGQDNDCDGNADENVFRQCNTECGVGTEACIGADQWGDCDSVIIAEEECDNDTDDDCDGQVDEACDCSEGDTKPCSNDVGVCTRGNQACDADGNWGPCQNEDGEAVTSPGELAEDCNGLDDDCNGMVDDIMIDAECGQDGPGECRMGRLSCEDGVRACVGGVEAMDETCDTLDNDCDGNIDEGAEEVPEICDGRDNDCDTRVDEDIAADQWEPNDDCAGASLLGSLGQPDGGDAAPTTMVRQGILTGGNSDWFGIHVEEDSNICVPLTGIGAQDYRVSAELTDLDGDTVYEICAYFVLNDGHAAACGAQRRCVRSDSGMPLELSDSREDRCARTDDTYVAVEVRAEGAPACAPYTVRFTATNE
jgi:hypothetical protein